MNEFICSRKRHETIHRFAVSTLHVTENGKGNPHLDLLISHLGLQKLLQAGGHFQSFRAGGRTLLSDRLAARCILRCLCKGDFRLARKPYNVDVGVQL